MKPSSLGFINIAAIGVGVLAVIYFIHKIYVWEIGRNANPQTP